MDDERRLCLATSALKIFKDVAFQALCKENADLRVQLFWKDHNVQRFRSAMELSNNWDKSPKCDCWKCAVNGRKEFDAETDSSRDCAFIPWFEEKVIACKMTIGYVLPTSTSQEHVSDTWNVVWDVDCHFVLIERMGGRWGYFAFGKKLWGAKTINDPELMKLKKLFEMLSVEELSDE